jgi:hypothetical protein
MEPPVGGRIIEGVSIAHHGTSGRGSRSAAGSGAVRNALSNSSSNIRLSEFLLDNGGQLGLEPVNVGLVS